MPNTWLQTISFTHIIIAPGIHTTCTLPSEDSSVSWPCIRFWQSIDYTRSIVSGGWRSATGVWCEVTDCTLYCFNIGQRQWFFWSLWERAECIYTTVRKSTADKKANKEAMSNTNTAFLTQVNCLTCRTLQSTNKIAMMAEHKNTKKKYSKLKLIIFGINIHVHIYSKSQCWNPITFPYL